MDRTIIHCDMNSFYASVELLSYPSLADKPVAVGGDAESRHGIILAKNEAAKKFNVKTAETIWQARRKCPDLIILPPHHARYQEFCDRINAIYLRYTDLVEPFSIDESWLDVTGSLKHFGMTGRELADDIRLTVRRETGLTLSAGVSFNKIFAKMGSDYKKPFATTEITRENYRDLLWPLPVSDLIFVGRSSVGRLQSMNIHTIGDLAQADVRLLSAAFGKHGAQMHAYANGEDDAPVLPYDTPREWKSVGNGLTFRRDLSGRQDIQTAVTALSDHVSARLRKHGLKCAGVKVDIKNPQLISVSRQAPLELATDLAKDIAEAAMGIIERNWNLRDPIRQLTVTGINVLAGGTEQELQLSMFPGQKTELDEKQRAVETAMDAIRKKYGRHSVIYGAVLDNDLGIEYQDE